MSTSGKDGSGGTQSGGAGEAVAGRGGARSFIPGTIRGKLLLVFGIVFLSAAASAIIAQRANVLVQQQLSSITEDNLPSLVFAHEVSAAMNNIRSVAAALATAETGPALSSRRGQLQRHIENAKGVINGLDVTGVDRHTESRLYRFVADAEELATELASTVEMRLQLHEQLSQKIQGLAGEYTRFNASIEPLVAQQLQFLGTESERVTVNTEETVSRLNDISFKGLIPLLSINAQLVTIKEALRTAYGADAETNLNDAWGDFVASSSVITRNLGELRGNAAVSDAVDVETLADGFGDILAVGIGDDSIFERKRRQLEQDGATRVDAAQDTSQLESSFADLERQLKLSTTLIRGQTVNVGIGLNRQVSDSLSAINVASVDGYGALLKLEALGNRAVGLLSVAPFVQHLADLDPLRKELDATETEVASLLDRLGTGAEVSATADLAGRLMEFGRGETGVFELRANELQALEQVDDLLFRTNALTQQMSVSAAEIVTNAREMTDAAATKALSSLDSSRVTLSLVIGMSLLTMLGAMVYVNRSLGSRLSAFSNAALALAEGDLHIKLPEATGRDELSRLMLALTVFRDTAAEMERSNLREIAQTRQRLIDAIESISEGFSLYDADDRLVVANDHYKSLLYAGMEHIIVPGARFESIIRNAADKGLISEAKECTDAWVAKRLAQHRNPSGVHLQERSNGRWIQINERRTTDGGTVAVYSDITEQKEHEAEIIKAKDAAEAALKDLQKAQQRLIQAEKMASLGQLTAGIAHEIKNPLNFVNNFAGLSDEMLGELADLLEAPIGALDQTDRDEAEDLLTTLRENLVKIAQHGKRADSIVKNMLMHAREGPSERQRVGLNAIADEALNLAYHGARAEHPGFNIEMVKTLDPQVGEIECYPQDLMRVFLNLISNGMYAADKRRGESDFSPTISLMTRSNGDQVEIEVRDNGVGIPPELRERIFIPFFTTKPPGEGTGLGLSLSYDIVVKQHGGNIVVDSESGAFTAFRVTLPRRLSASGGESQ